MGCPVFLYGGAVEVRPIAQDVTEDVTPMDLDGRFFRREAAG